MSLSPRTAGIAAAIVALCTSASVAQRIYWTSGSPKSDFVRRARLDGSNVEALVASLTDLGNPSGIALDLEAGKVYWAMISTIQRANLDGSGVEDVLPGLQTATDVELDLAHGHMYFGDSHARMIRRANLDGSNVVDLISGISVGRLALDLPAGKLYWEGNSTIRRMNLDGTSVEELVVGLEAPMDIALDVGAGKMYWTEGCYSGELPCGPDYQADLVQRANLDGSAIETILVLDNPWGIVLDPEAGVLYLTHGSTISRANLDGTGLQELLQIPGEMPQHMALDLRACGGHGQDDGGVCTCDPGWDGPNCDCSTAPCPNDCSSFGTCQCGTCVCDAGYGGADCTTLVPIPRVRLFMAADGQQQLVPITGHTVAALEAGSSVRLMVWLHDTTGPGDLLSGYQLVIPGEATPAPGATGLVRYVDNNQGYGGGDSVFVDVQRPDFVYFGLGLETPPVYPETFDYERNYYFGTFVSYNHASGVDPGVPGEILYLCEFEFEATSNASGEFELRFQLPPDPPPFTSLFRPIGSQMRIDEFQPLTIVIAECGDGQIEALEQCDDGNDVPHDGCTNCILDFCGDGIVNNGGTETCDDGNTLSGDGCSADCALEFCGDGIINNLPEECDDGNAEAGDGCGANCFVEHGFACNGQPSVCATFVPAVTAWGMALLAGLLIIGICRCACRTSAATRGSRC